MPASRRRQDEGSGDTAPPRVWVLMGHRAGDNSQVQALGEALGWPFEVRRFVYAPYEKAVNLPFTATLAGVVKSRSSALGPPWPDLILTAGRRNEPIARWIQRRAGKRVRVVHVGRPWARIERFDLVVTTPQYRLPALGNVVQNEGPLHRVTPQRLADAAARWEPRLAHLPRPYVALLAGGHSGPYPFDTGSGARLGQEASALAARLGGSLLVTTSARTRPATEEALFGAIREPAYRYRWEPDSLENPYFAFLGLAEQIIVTADSVSMMIEAAATRKPVHLFDTGEGVTSMRADVTAREALLRLPRHMDRVHWKAFVYRLTMRYGPRRWTRDIRIVQRHLVDSGRAVWLGDPWPGTTPPPLGDLDRAVAGVRELFDER